MTDTTERDQALRSAEEGGSLAPSTDETPPTKLETRLETFEMGALTVAMGLTAAAYGTGHSTPRAFGLGALSLRHAGTAVKDGYKERETAVEPAVNAIGTALWAAGMAVDDRGLKTGGPALNSFAHLAAAGMQYHQGKGEWKRTLIDMVEQGAFAVVGGTGSPAAGSVAFGSAALGFLVDAKDDKGLLGHAVGAAMLAAGAGLKYSPLQSSGAGVVGAAEIGRLLYPAIENYLKKRSPSVPLLELPTTPSSPTDPTTTTAPAALYAPPVATPRRHSTQSDTGPIPSPRTPSQTARRRNSI
ncbi:hypothetical protein ACFQ7N_23450 [Streptomyces niveus]|uniref:hypothetical protein n=1 Tax=Streptomyces niveus TaxID=193462 RepID=UPI0036916B58